MMRSLFRASFITLLILSVSSWSTVFAQESEYEELSQGELEQLLSPIALYPDTILSHILIAATYPLEVVQAERWSKDHPELEGSAAVEAVSEMDWDPSVQALVAFPNILQRMSEDLDWTQSLGEAFLDNEERVLASIQDLRQLAADAGSLDELDKLRVSRDADQIIIQPVEERVVYIPYYDTRRVYGNWRWSMYDPIYWDYPYAYDYYPRHDRRRFYWGPRVSISFGFFFNTFSWHDRHIVRINHRYYRPYDYYNYRQIVRHQHGQRWHHNPHHRRGVSYRNQRVRNHYVSDRGNLNQDGYHGQRHPERPRTQRDSAYGDGLERHFRDRQQQSNQRRHVPVYDRGAKPQNTVVPRANRSYQTTNPERVRRPQVENRPAIRQVERPIRQSTTRSQSDYRPRQATPSQQRQVRSTSNNYQRAIPRTQDRPQRNTQVQQRQRPVVSVPQRSATPAPAPSTRSVPVQRPQQRTQQRSSPQKNNTQRRDSSFQRPRINPR